MSTAFPATFPDTLWSVIHLPALEERTAPQATSKPGPASGFPLSGMLLMHCRCAATVLLAGRIRGTGNGGRSTAHQVVDQLQRARGGALGADGGLAQQAVQNGADALHIRRHFLPPPSRRARHLLGPLVESDCIVP